MPVEEKRRTRNERNEIQMAEVTKGKGRKGTESNRSVPTGVGEAPTYNWHREQNQTDKPEHSNCVQEMSNYSVKNSHICEIPVFFQVNSLELSLNIY